MLTGWYEKGGLAEKVIEVGDMEGDFLQRIFGGKVHLDQSLIVVLIRIVANCITWLATSRNCWRISSLTRPSCEPTGWFWELIVTA